MTYDKNKDTDAAGAIRLQKVLAAAGMGSRRACELLIEEGRVEVDGQIVLEQGMRVDPETSVVRVDGSRIPTAAGHIVLALNKPRGVHSTMTDDRGRPCVGDLLKGRKERLFHVGRLDADTEGLLILTNDGDLAQHLSHPSHGVAKTYLAQIRGTIAKDLGKQLREGIELEDGPIRVDSFRLIQSSQGRALVEVVIHEGRKHIVRRMLESVGHPVEALVRTKVGPVSLGDIKPGRVRVLGVAEVGELYASVGL
jgi:23S rRNA pseudouridine2605 synthase